MSRLAPARLGFSTACLANHSLAEDGKALPADIRRLVEKGQDKYL